MPPKAGSRRTKREEKIATLYEPLDNPEPKTSRFPGLTNRIDQSKVSYGILNESSTLKEIQPSEFHRHGSILAGYLGMPNTQLLHNLFLNPNVKAICETFVRQEQNNFLADVMTVKSVIMIQDISNLFSHHISRLAPLFHTCSPAKELSVADIDSLAPEPGTVISGRMRCTYITLFLTYGLIRTLPDIFKSSTVSATLGVSSLYVDPDDALRALSILRYFSRRLKPQRTLMPKKDFDPTKARPQRARAPFYWDPKLPKQVVAEDRASMDYQKTAESQKSQADHIKKEEEQLMRDVNEYDDEEEIKESLSDLVGNDEDGWTREQTEPEVEEGGEDESALYRIHAAYKELKYNFREGTEASTKSSNFGNATQQFSGPIESTTSASALRARNTLADLLQERLNIQTTQNSNKPEPIGPDLEYRRACEYLQLDPNAPRIGKSDRLQSWQVIGIAWLLRMEKPSEMR